MTSPHTPMTGSPSGPGGAHFSGHQPQVQLIDNPQNIDVAAFSVAASSQVMRGAFPVSNYQSWTASLTLSSGAATSPYLYITLQWWLDSAATLLVWEELFVIDYVNFTTYIAHGPMYGPYMTVTYFNNDGAQAVTITPQLMGSNRVFSSTVMQSIGTLSSAPPGIGTDYVLLSTDYTNLAPSSATTAMPGNYFPGPVFIKFHADAASIAANSVQLSIKFSPTSDFQNNTGLLIYAPAVANGTSSPDVFVTAYFPRRPYSVVVTNTSSTITVSSVRVRIFAKEPGL